MLRKSGQSTLEYIIIFTAIVAAVIVFAGILKPQLGRIYNHLGNQTEQAVNKIDFSQ